MNTSEHTSPDSDKGLAHNRQDLLYQEKLVDSPKESLTRAFAEKPLDLKVPNSCAPRERVPLGTTGFGRSKAIVRAVLVVLGLACLVGLVVAVRALWHHLSGQ